MDENILGTEKISKLFIMYSFPAIISMIIVGAQTIVSGIFLGKFVGQNALATINLIQPFMQVIVGFSMIISVGSMSFIGRKLGESNREKAQDIFKTAFIGVMTISFAIAITGTIFNEEIAILLGSNGVLLEGVSTYIRIIALFAPAISLMHLSGFTGRIIGKPELYLKATILSLVINLFLNYLFIKEWGFGIKGAAIATGLANIGGLLIVVGPLINKKNPINIFMGKFDKSTIVPVIYNGSSEGVIAIAIATTAYIFNMAFMKIAGVAGIAAFTTINYIGQFTILLMFGISDGISPILSYNYGNKKYYRLDHILKLANKVNLIIGVVLFLVLFIFGKQLVMLFINDNSTIVNLAVNGSKIYAFAFLLSGFNIIYSGYFTAIGDAKSSIIISASRGIVFIVLGILILPSIFGTTGVWLTIPFAEVMTFLVSICLIKRDKKVFQESISLY